MVNWPTPTAIAYGTALSSTQLNATTDVQSVCTYAPPAGTVLSAGTQTLSVSCTANDTTNYGTPGVATVSLIVENVSLVSSANPSTYGSSVTFTATVTPSNDTNAVTFTDNGVALGSPVTPSSGVAQLAVDSLLAGTHSIQACSAAGGSYVTVCSSVLSQVVNLATPTISAWPTASPIIFTITG